MEETKPTIKVVLCLIEKDGKFLLIKRKIPAMKVEWAFPGGVTEPGENDLSAAVREARQETGIRVIANEKLFERKHPDTLVLVSYVHCTPIDDKEPVVGEPEEISLVEWVLAEEVLTRFTSDVHPLIRDFVLKHVRAAEDDG